MCECAPLGITCEYDGYNTTSCKVNRLNLALTEIYQSIPLIGRLIPNYKCPNLRIKEEGADS